MLARAIKRVRDGLVASVYPEQCRVCDGPVESYDDGVVCRPCWLDPAITVLIADPICPKCGIPLPGADGINHSRRCGRCESFPFSAARASATYAGAIEASILQLKSKPRVCRRLREIILRTYRARSADLPADVVIPVPLHRSRERERGFNQARLIAHAVARANGLRLDHRSLVRVKPTERHRAGLDAADRARSVERAFKVVRPEVVKNASVLLVDDVFTTGSTISAAARILLDAGAARVSVLTVARVVRGG
ncbi:MAG TPA: ComF family protein [Blastocatellia bacterium]|nr:ComF family protein [Blastocatellia bacterium]